MSAGNLFRGTLHLRSVRTGLLVEGGLLLLALALGVLTGYSPLLLWNPTAVSLLMGVAATIPMVLALGVMAALPFGPIRQLFEVMRGFYRDFFAGSSIMDLILISVAAGIGEEFLFRGFLQQALGDLFGPESGLLLASIAFGLAHSVTLTYALLATLFGCFLGWLMQYTDDLVAPIVTHALFDCVALLYLRFRAVPA